MIQLPPTQEVPAISEARLPTIPPTTIRAPEPWWLMPVIDLALALAAFGLAYFVRYELQVLRPLLEINRAAFHPYLPYYGLFVLWLYLNYRGSGLYKNVRGRSWLEEVYLIINGTANAALIIMAASFIFQPLVFSRLMIVYAAVITILLQASARIVQRQVRGHRRSKGIGVQRVLIVGVGEIGQAVLRTMIARKELGYHPIGFLDEDPARATSDLGRVRALGTIRNLEAVTRAYAVNLVVIAQRWSDHDRLMDLVQAARRGGADVRVVPDVFQLNMKQVQVENLDGIPLLGVNGATPFHGTNRVVKRAMDIGLILLASPVLLPIFGLVALAIRVEGPGPIFYRQRRVGENGREFGMFKFRSMIPDADLYLQSLVVKHKLDPRHPKIPDDPRITRVGRFIRRTSIDELPNLINVLRGQMSLVGPRPPTPDEVDLYEDWHKQRLKIMPGMTGLWQISGRSDVPFEEMCLLDVYYIENWSVRLDLQILMMTLPRVLLRRGAY
jgi:exopolysaccharide biosynthesis polyprenyl glycosylphosphotransferase